MKNIKKEILIIFLLLALFLLIFYNLFRLNREYKEILKERENLINQKSSLEKEIASLNNNLIELNNNYSILYENFQNLKKDYEDLYKKYLEIYDSFISLKDQLEIYAKNKLKVQEYIFNNINYNFSNENFIFSIRNYCISGKTLNYPCLVEILKSKFGFSYKELELFKDEVNISKFVESRYGDCKSWSIFSIAIIRYFYKRGEISNLKLYYNYPGERFILYYEGNTYYYYPNSKELVIYLDNLPYLYVFCYYNLTKPSGHCISGISNILLNPDNYNNTNLIIFEPQTGEYLGNMKEFLMKHPEIIIDYMFLDNGLFYHRPLYLIQWSNDIWIWI